MHSDSVGSHPSYIVPWYFTFRSRCDLYYFWENFPKWQPSICTDPPSPPPPQWESLPRLAACWRGGGGVAWAKRRMTFETAGKWWSFFAHVSGWLELCQTFKNSPMFSNVKKERIWIQRRSAKSGDRRNFTINNKITICLIAFNKLMDFLRRKLWKFISLNE